MDVCEGQDGKFVVVDKRFKVELEDLHSVFTYVAGKSRSGIVYKVVGVGRESSIMLNVVGIQRLNEGDVKWSIMEAIARFVSPIWLPCKLLITDFIRNGSL